MNYKESVGGFDVYHFYNGEKSISCPDFDMLCVYNNMECFKNELLGTLDKQRCDFSVRLIALDNRSGAFSSMTSAYNKMMGLVQSENVIFTHQDIRYGDENALERMLREILLVPENGIWGTGGVFNRTREIPIVNRGEPLRVESVDECLFGMKTVLCRKLKFNEEICDNWHMYSAEMCLHNKVEGGSTYVIKSDNVWHLSPGVVSSGYVRTLYKVINHYKKKGVDTVWTTCAKVDLTKPYHLYIAMWLAKHEVLNKVIRPIKKRIHSK